MILNTGVGPNMTTTMDTFPDQMFTLVFPNFGVSSSRFRLSCLPYRLIMFNWHILPALLQVNFKTYGSRDWNVLVIGDVICNSVNYSELVSISQAVRNADRYNCTSLNRDLCNNFTMNNQPGCLTSWAVSTTNNMQAYLHVHHRQTSTYHNTMTLECPV